jgi:hypothetical protein
MRLTARQHENLPSASIIWRVLKAGLLGALPSP